jgi:uncharacterized protein with ParB-like and HNH nuclease domain
VGVVTLEKVPEETYLHWEEDRWIIEGKSYEPFYVVDGQQRLTTTVLLIQAICEISLEKGIDSLNYTKIDDIRRKYIVETHDAEISRSYIFGYEKDNPSYEFLKNNIFKETSTDGYSNEETIYTTNLENAKLYFKNELNVLDQAEIEKIFKKITQHLLFNSYAIQDDIDVFIAFETMNNRGLRLSNLELLKNRLIYLSTKFTIGIEDKKELRRIINSAWRSIYHYLGKNKQNPLKDDIFLYTHTNMHFGRLKRSMITQAMEYGIWRVGRVDMADELSTRLLENIFSTKKNENEGKDSTKPMTPTEVKSYVESISRAVEVWFEVKNPSLSKRFNDEEKLWLDKLNRCELPFRYFAPVVLEFYLKKHTKKNSLKFLKALEKYSFVSTLIGGHYIISKDFSEKIMDTTSNRTTDSIVKLLEGRITEIIEKPTEDYVSLTNRIERQGFYEWPGIRYFLYEYELSLKEKSKSKKEKIDWSQYIKESEDFVSVEHIYPQNATLKYWKDRFSGFNRTEKRILRDSLGNLLPLSKPKNSSLQNKGFVDKIDNGDGVGYRYGSYAENAVSAKSEWTPAQILERGIALLNFMEERWGIDLGSKDDKVKILKLDFLKSTK